MRPTKQDCDRYLWLVSQGKELAWNDAYLLEQNPFRVADPRMTFTALRSMRDLAHLGTQLGRDTGSIERWITELENGAEKWFGSTGCSNTMISVLLNALSRTCQIHPGERARNTMQCYMARIDFRA